MCVTVSNYKKHQQITTGYTINCVCVCTSTRIARFSTIQSPSCVSQINRHRQWTCWTCRWYPQRVFCILVDVRRSFTLFLHPCDVRTVVSWSSDATEDRAVESPIQEPAKKLLCYAGGPKRAPWKRSKTAGNRRVDGGWAPTKVTWRKRTYHWTTKGIHMKMRRLWYPNKLRNMAPRSKPTMSTKWGPLFFSFWYDVHQATPSYPLAILVLSSPIQKTLGAHSVQARKLWLAAPGPEAELVQRGPYYHPNDVPFCDSMGVKQISFWESNIYKNRSSWESNI